MRLQLLKAVKNDEGKKYPKGVFIEVDHKTAAKWIKDKSAIDATPADPKEIQNLVKNLTTNKS